MPTLLILTFFTIFGWGIWSFSEKMALQITRWSWGWIFLAVISDLVAVLAIRFMFLQVPVGVAMTLPAAYPILTSLLSMKFLNEKISRSQFLGIILACVGVVVLNT